jgi:hypothetical protein
MAKVQLGSFYEELIDRFTPRSSAGVYTIPHAIDGLSRSILVGCCVLAQAIEAAGQDIDNGIRDSQKPIPPFNG